MKILSVNAGSSSLKFQAYEMPEERVLISGNFERIGNINDSFYTIKINGEKIEKKAPLSNHEDAVNLLTEELLNNNIVKSLDEIKGIGHRVVAGGDIFNSSVILDDEKIQQISDLSVLAPLHNPGAVIGMKAFKRFIPDAIGTAVFDTAFHQTMSPSTYLYALPYEWYTKYKVRRYGAHGTSHKFVAIRLSEILNKNDAKVIVCHIGNGASITAVDSLKCVDTSMGFTPNAGVIMGTRCGDIDASIIPYMMKQADLSISDIDRIINKESGLLGISRVSNDHRDIEHGIENNDEMCILAEKMYIRRIVDYIAKYYVLLGGVDAIAFTAGVGENSYQVRKRVIDSLKVLGIKLDEEANKVMGREALITTSDSSIPCYVIPTDEELMIARDTYNLVK